MRVGEPEAQDRDTAQEKGSTHTGRSREAVFVAETMLGRSLRKSRPTPGRCGENA
jgi:hypothetical protein